MNLLDVRHVIAGLCFSFAFCTGTQAQNQSAQDWVQAGRVYESKLESQRALDCYLQAERLAPTDADLLVNIARQYRHLMADARSEKDKLRLGNQALEYGYRAAKLGPQNSDAQLSVAISYGKMLPLLGAKEQVQSSKLIRQGAERAIQLNPRNDLAWHILGRWHRNVAEISGLKRTLAALVYEKLPEGTHADAVKCFTKAMEINPKRLIHYIELGRTYAQMGEPSEARRFLAKGLKMPSVEKDDEESKALGRSVLAKL
ncbi:hypothetical protein SAMN02745166_03271 [Prosthecobacter debontii]|uniref:Regulator of microtubule dynamics protein 1 n=1 Tax=Prosthecobacter debontii TaxID=48467 RepID=A0A1T4YGK8_9BACT|nr:hypothetical protein [Prosthecobacter debontii]SKB00972.1 hypothetical protein SAMN02745166_03271 [Prosthecobacter debontii]